MSWRGLAGALVVLAAGCAHEQAGPVARPVPDLADNGPPVASYQLPVKQPKGTVHVVSMGPVALPAGSDGQAAFYLHVRLAALNGSDAVTWSFDPNNQVLSYAGQTILPAYAEAAAGEIRGPVLSLGRGERGHLDLYYPPPVGDVPAVTFSWRLQRGKDVLAMGTELRRIDHQRNGARYAYYQPADDAHLAVDLGMSSWWWQDYYFWRDDRCWWSYPRAHFHTRHPTYQRPVRVAGPAGAGAQSGGGTRGSLSRDEPDTSSWRGVPASGGDSARTSSASNSSSSDTSSWRNPPSQDSSTSSSSSSSSSSDSSSSSSSSSSPPSSSSSSSGSSSGGESKSGWRR